MQDRKPLKTRTYVHEPSLFARENLFYVKMAGEYHRVSDYRIEGNGWRACWSST